MAFISRMFNAAQAGPVVWDVAELDLRFIGACLQVRLQLPLMRFQIQLKSAA